MRLQRVSKTIANQPIAWTKMPGLASHVSVGRDGSVWCVNPQDQVFRWNPSVQNWETIPGMKAVFIYLMLEGSLCQISVYDAQTVIGVNRNMEIWYWDRYLNGWKQAPGLLRSVSVGASGYQHVWGVNSQGELWFHRSRAKEDFLQKQHFEQTQSS